MRTVKIILLVISVLTIVFFATGLFVKEVSYKTQISISKPVSEVFTAFNKIDSLKQWMPEIESIEPIQENKGKIGSSYKMIVDNQGEDLEMTKKILAYVPNKKVAFQFTSEVMTKTDDFIFTSENNKTLIVQNSTIRSGSYVLSCVFPYFIGKLKATSQDYLNRFKEMVENSRK